MHKTFEGLFRSFGAMDSIEYNKDTDTLIVQYRGSELEIEGWEMYEWAIENGSALKEVKYMDGNSESYTLTDEPMNIRDYFAQVTHQDVNEFLYG